MPALDLEWCSVVVFHKFMSTRLLFLAQLEVSALPSPPSLSRRWTRYDEVRRGTTSYDEIRRGTTRYDEVQRDMTSYDDIRRGTTKYDEVRRDTTRYDEVRRNTLDPETNDAENRTHFILVRSNVVDSVLKW